ncbi:MAG: VWA domain-containing protein [Vicinamibacterales bacterium]
MTHAARRLIPVLVICSTVAAPQAQTPARASDARTRDIYVSVLDNKGAPVPGLTAADFVVREDGTAREVLDARPAEEPLQVALLIDDSQAASDATTYLRDGLAAFLERLHGKGEVGLITIGERPTVLAPYTEDTEQLKQKVGRIFPRPGSGAYLLDAILEATRALSKREAKRAVILAVSFEGIDYSNQHYQVVLDELKKTDVALHVIAVGSPSSSLSDEMRNRNIVIAEGTGRTGGRRDQVLAVSGIPDKLKQAADELVNQYVVTYARPDKLIPPKKVEVSSKRRDLTVRARTLLAER